MTLILPVLLQLAIITNTTIGIIAARFLPYSVLSLPFFLQPYLLKFFNMEMFVEIVQVRSIVRFSRADLVVLLFEVVEVW